MPHHLPAVRRGLVVGSGNSCMRGDLRLVRGSIALSASSLGAPSSNMSRALSARTDRYPVRSMTNERAVRAHAAHNSVDCTAASRWLRARGAVAIGGFDRLRRRYRATFADASSIRFDWPHCPRPLTCSQKSPAAPAPMAALRAGASPSWHDTTRIQDHPRFYLIDGMAIIHR